MSLKHAEDLMGRSRQIIFILSLSVKQAGFLALLMQFLVKLSGNATQKKVKQKKWILFSQTWHTEVTETADFIFKY